jgi:hypothetical protein
MPLPKQIAAFLLPYPKISILKYRSIVELIIEEERLVDIIQNYPFETIRVYI